MADLSTLTTFPGQPDASTSWTQFCRVEIVEVDLEGDDSATTVEDIGSPSLYEQYRSPVVQDYDDEDAEEDTLESCVALTFYTDSGEATRYITDSQSDDIYQVFAQVLFVLGQKGWQAINLQTDEDYEETWFLQRTVRA